MTVISGVFCYAFKKAVVGNFNKNIIPFTNGETKEVGD